MRVLPILFNTEMVQAIIDDRKTVTRRLVKPRPIWVEQDKKYRAFPSAWYWTDRIRAVEDYQLFAQMLKVEAAPYNIGDILYVRETWDKLPDGYHYRASEERPDLFGWCPSLHMPKEAARNFLRVMDVRAERLQSEFFKRESAIFELRAEGIDIGETCRECISTYGCPCCNDEDTEGGSECGMLDDVRDDFARLWDGVVKPAFLDIYGWAANPWVFRVEFERCEKPEGFAT